MGMMPLRLTRPTVGLRPTIPFTDAGQVIEPSVSVPTAAAHKFAATATLEPDEEPQGLRSRTYGFLVCPPRLLQPLLENDARKLAHSLRFVLPSITAPAAHNFWTRKASSKGLEPSKASEPAVVVMSMVSMLSLSNIGTPWSGPRTRPAARSLSSTSAMSSALALSSMTEFRVGPFLSSRSMRSK